LSLVASPLAADRYCMVSWCARVSVILSLRRIRDSEADDEQRILRSPALREASLRAEPMGSFHSMTRSF